MSVAYYNFRRIKVVYAVQLDSEHVMHFMHVENSMCFVFGFIIIIYLQADFIRIIFHTVIPFAIGIIIPLVLTARIRNDPALQNFGYYEITANG